MNSLNEQVKISRKTNLALKYSNKWILKTQAARDHKDHVLLYHM